MTQPLAGIRIVEVATWAYVPSCAAVLADMGAEVIKIEPPAGDPIRQLTVRGVKPGDGGFTFMWEIFNRGKRSLAMDLAAEGAVEVLHRLLADADVFLTNLLPPARRKLRIDVADLQARHPRLIYGVGSGQGAFGPDAEKGGFDAISFWARAGVASAVTPAEAAYPLSMPGAAFGDTISGLVLAGAISAAIARRAMTGEASVVDGSLLATGMWAMQPGIVGSHFAGTAELKIPPRAEAMNPLVNTYRTADGRFIAINFLQAQRYWPGLCEAAGVPALAADPRFATDAGRAANAMALVAELDALFARHSLAQWREILGRQQGQWDVVQQAAELYADPAAVANGYIQEVDYGDGRSIRMVSAPVQFDREPPKMGPAPGLGAHSDAVLAEAGYSEEEILGLRIAGVLE